MPPAAQRARLDLPNVPEEIFRIWLDQVLEARGWPPAGAEWEEILLGRPLEFWRELKWTRELLPLAPSELGPRSLEAGLRVVDADLLGNGEPPSPESTERLDALCEFIDARGTLPAPLILVSTLDGYEVADGRRRLAAMLAVAARRGADGFVPRRVEAWVGSIRAG